MPWNKPIGPQAPGYHAESKSAGDDPRHPQIVEAQKKKKNNNEEQ